MTAGGDWGEIIDKEEAERFVGREQEMETFRLQINRTPLSKLIFYITGQGGVGKTTLLNRYREIARNFGFLLADSDEQQRDVPAVLGRFAQQLTEQGFSLRRFNERYKVYRQKMDEIESDPDAPQGLADMLGRTIVRSTFIAGDMIPGVREGLRYLPRESREEVEMQASQWTTYLMKKWGGNKDEVALLREPAAILTPLFFEDLNEIAKKQRVLLCFENFEATRQELQEWLLRLREYKPSQSIRLAIAGRDEPGAKWDPLHNVTMTVQLDVFTEQEAEAFLDVYKITDNGRRAEILEFSGRLPVLMSWLAAPEGQEPDPSVPTHDIVERFLRWVPPAWREVALLGAIPRSFNVDILKLLLEHREQAIDERSAFDWLLTMTFIEQHAEGWRYHNVVRRMMLHYQRQMKPQAYRQTHMALANFYSIRRDELDLADEEQWTNEQWRKDTLAYVYHYLVADPIKHWVETLSLFVVAVRQHRIFAVEMTKLLNSEDVHDELSREQNDLIRLFYQQLQAVENGDLKDGFAMFNKLCAIGDLFSLAKCYALAYRGECHRQNRKWEEALCDFEEALHYNSKDAWTIASRGDTYNDMGRSQEALADFDRAIAIEEKSSWIIGSRGEIYWQMGRSKEALTDFDRAIALDENYTWAIASRGLIYLEIGRSKEALTDFDRAIVLDEKDAFAFAHRGETHRQMEHYQEALADFDRAIAFDEKDAWAIASRGLTHRLMEHYEEALTDFDRAIALDEKNASIIAHRGETHRQMEHYQEALTDFDRAIVLDEKYAFAFAHRGETHRQMEHYQEALTDFDRAIALDEKDAFAFAHRGEIYFRMKSYQEALVDLDRAIALDEKEHWPFLCRGETYLRLRRFQEALADLDRAIALNEKSPWGRYCRAQVYTLAGQISAFESDMRAALELGHVALRNTPGDCQLGFNLALYHLAAGKLAEAEAQYGHFALVCSSQGELQDAVVDLDDLLAMEPSNELARRMRDLLQSRMVEVR